MMMMMLAHSDKWANVSKQGFLFTDLPLQLFNQDWHHPTNKKQTIMVEKCQLFYTRNKAFKPNFTQTKMCKWQQFWHLD